MSAVRPETLAVVAGRPAAPGAPLNVAPTFASTYRDGGLVGYGRWDNPTWAAFEEAMGALEGGRAVAFSSGQAATAAVLDRLALGATVLLSADAYTGTAGYLAEAAAAGRLRLRRADLADPAATAAALDDGVDLVWAESPTNPLLDVVDLSRLCRAAAERGVPAVVDNTFATPLLQRPLEVGAALSLHSATKYVGGHSDLLLGVAVAADDATHAELVARRTLAGAVPGVMEAFLALRGLRTLAVRLERQQRSAGVLAERLAASPGVGRVRYPGLASDPGHRLATAQMRGPGAVVSFELATAEAADRFVAGLRLAVPTTSLGGVETTVERRSRWPGSEGIPAGLVRMSVGLEHVEDLWSDLDRALSAAAGPAPAGASPSPAPGAGAGPAL